MNIGLFLSKADEEISKTIDLNYLNKHYKKNKKQLKTVKVFNSFWKNDAIGGILNEIAEKKLDAIVLAGDSPRHFHFTKGGKLFIKRIIEAGINSNKIAFANLKEQVALPHKGKTKQATNKAQGLIDVAIEKVRICSPIEMIDVAPRRSVMIIGTNPGAFFAAQKLLEVGYPVQIIEKGKDIPNLIQFKNEVLSVLDYVENHPKSTFYFNTEVIDCEGYLGDYNIKIKKGKKEENVKVGGIIIAIENDLELTQKLHPILFVDIDIEGYFKSLESPTLPTQTNNEGICLISYKSESSLDQLFSLADSAFSYFVIKLDQDVILHKKAISEVDENVCGGCGTCVKTCFFRAASIDPIKKISQVDTKRCKACGNCVTACPTGARDLITYPNKYLQNSIGILSKYKKPNTKGVLAFLCEGCGYPALDIAGLQGLQYSANVFPLAVRCAGRIDTQFILYAFFSGFDGVVLCVCKEGHCRNVVGNTDFERRANLFREVLRSRGIDPDKLRILGVTPTDGEDCVSSIESFLKDLK